MDGIWLASYIALWLLLLILGVLVVSLMRNVGLLATAVEQLRHHEDDSITLTPGAIAPDVPLMTLDGQPTAPIAHGGTPLALTVISPGCGPCLTLLHAMHDGHAAMHDLPPATQQIVVSLGDAAATRGLLADDVQRAGTVLLADAAVLKERWGVSSTPTTVLLDADGRYLRHHTGFTAPARQRNGEDPAAPVHRGA